MVGHFHHLGGVQAGKVGAGTAAGQFTIEIGLAADERELYVGEFARPRARPERKWTGLDRRSSRR